MNFKKTFYDNYKAIAENIMPDLQVSNCRETGMLTKKEFKVAGDYLITQNPSWRWNAEKTCLELKHVLCNFKDFSEDCCDESSPKLVEVEIEDDSSDEFDFSDDEGIILKDESTIVNNDDNNHYYDISITYDQYYRTPRIWFFGTNYCNHPLKDKDMYRDFSVEHSKVTLTKENHPILDLNCMSVHPCQHANAMIKMFKFELEKSEELNIEKYMIYFLKFVSCIIPQMNFDFTKL